MKNKKSLGQHWLKNREILDEIADNAVDGVLVDEGAVQNSAKQGLCLEIGPGLGTLTSSLLKRFDKVLAVEFDAELARKLPGSFPGKNLEVINVDFLQFDLSGVSAPYYVAGNIPYYITSPIIEKLLTTKNLPERIVLLVQKEVAERILSDRESVLSLLVKNRAKAYPGAVVLRDEFTPPPKVDSQVIILEPHEPLVSDAVLKFISVGFSSPRKKLIHNLEFLKDKETLMRAFSDLGLDPNVRPADLHLGDYQRLFESML
ncbi:MAG: 16S rRNA (adenine(1518)-N(6)/adenine(1519)-N(6))-dimethyltransferase RsmA [Candidatus Saccharibacteria bacterium]|nr:16S rRNA (adenine(1518)-N(6)/adenine(1519)-N(6))-dimethyltransferase RsmA [Candidatus Saccharibacteria bacterium]